MHKALIVEDERNIAEGLRFIVNQMCEGWSASDVALDARTALESIRQQPVDLILTDIKMPGISGLEMIETIRYLYPHILTVIISGYADFEYARTALHCSVVDYILKPVSPEKVKAVLRKAEELIEGRKLRNLLPAHKQLARARFERALQHALAESSREQVLQLLGQLAELVLEDDEQPSGYLERLQMQYNTVLHRVLGNLHESGMGGADESRIWSMLDELMRVPDQAGLDEWFARLSVCMIQSVRDGCEKKHPQVQAALELVRQRYSQPITLKSVADGLYLNPNYLSDLFKKHTGLGFNEYLTQLRVDAAKQLLLGPGSLKLYDIAQRVGYTSERYFIEVFKKSVGMTPSRFRSVRPPQG